jgi:arylsulfatase A-like enzyme
MKTIFILLDSLNRHYLPIYGNPWVRTPNIDRLAARGAVFENHYCGSLPCMPARRDMMTGRLNFLEGPWGPVEPWDDCLPNILRQQQATYSHMITDHYHYFHSGGECYHTLFDSWEFERGQEGDVWRPLVKAPEPPTTRGKGKVRRAYWSNRQFMDPERDEDYSTPRCFQRAIEFLENNHQEDNWHLHLEAFDPHEPFDCPRRYVEQYNDTWDRYIYTWPQYGKIDPQLDDAEAIAHIQKQYAGTLSMADAWLGKLLDTLDRLALWEDTTVILTTDHGHLLGDHGYWAKNVMMDYNELAHIPLVVYRPGIPAGQRIRQGLTTTIDLMPTLLNLFGAQPTPHVRGKSILPLLEQDGPHHEAVLYGYFGKDINLTDGTYTYCRQPLPGSTTHHHTAMPRAFADFIPRAQLANAETGCFLPTTYGIPHYRMSVPSHRHMDAPDFNPIYDIHSDPFQSDPIQDPDLEARLERLMLTQLGYHDAPESQYTRVGLSA